LSRISVAKSSSRYKEDIDMLKLSLIAFLVLLLTACGAGSGAGLDANGQPAGNAPATPLAADFTSIQQNIFTPVCTVCHSGASAPLGLRLDATNSYAALVGVSSVEVPSTLRVNPGNPASSYLIAKLEGTAAVGGQMPLGGPALSQASIEFVKQWIAAGAPPAVSAPPPVNQPPSVISTNPASGSTVTTLPATINIAFSQEMNAASINNTTVILQRSGGDGNFTSGNEVAITPASLNLSTANPALLTISLTGIASTDDSYQLMLVGSGSAPLLDLNANALDGDGNGSAGGDYLLAFVVQAPPSGGGGLQATWRSIQDNVFTQNCIVCHSGASAPEGLRLDEANSYAMLVGVASQQVPTLFRVAPGNANNSYLIRKLEGAAGISGSQMPRGGTPLPQTTIDIIRQWINAGAEQGSTTPPPPGNTAVDVTLSAPTSVASGDELTVSASVVNNSTSSVSGLGSTLSWTPPGSLRLRSGEVTQSIATLNAGQTVTLSWTLRAEEVGTTALTVTVTDNNSQTIGSDNANVSIVD
ncbi:MAG TPA: Ig-like domain-containing protein, partial [Gammaproteobacteria bacterium]|nr:Ig-like domain-containing protein [Gammaproteobacteria bacterium]